MHKGANIVRFNLKTLHEVLVPEFEQFCSKPVQKSQQGDLASAGKESKQLLVVEFHAKELLLCRLYDIFREL